MANKDIVATLGSYEAKEGKKKYITRKVGTYIETSKGPRIKLEASFNPAGCHIEGDGSIWLALFDQKPREGYGPTPAASPAQDQGGNQGDEWDDIDF